MGYLHINGYQVKTAIGGEVSFEETFSRRGYSPGGNYQFGRNHIGRTWRFTTIPLPRDEAQALASMINMLGDSWRFGLSAASDGIVYVTDNTTSEVYSDKRRIPQTTEAECSVMAAYAGDGARVYDWNGNAYGAFEGSTGSVLVEPATTNLLTGDESDPESGALGWTATSGSATVTADTSNYWRGAGSANVTWSAGGAGAKSATIAPSAVTYVFSVYVKPSAGGEQVRIQITGDNSGSTQTDYTLNADKDRWTRLYHAHTANGSDTTIQCFVRGIDSSGTIYIDGAQLEQSVNDGYPTAWVDAGTNPFGGSNGTRPAGVLDFDTFVSGYTNGFTASTWVNFQFTGPTANRYILDTADASARALLLISTADRPRAYVVSSDSSELFVNGSVLTAGWHHIASVYDRSNDTLYLYVDGVADGSDNTWSGARQHWNVDSAAGDFSIGSAGTAGANNCPGPIGSLQVSPFAMPAAMITSLYNSGADARLPPGLTPLSVHGDFMGAGDRWVKAYGQVNRVTNVPHQDNTLGWQAGGAVVDFTLYEATGK